MLAAAAAAAVVMGLFIPLIRPGGNGMIKGLALVMVATSLFSEIISGPEQQNQSQRQTGRDDHQEILEQKARGPGDRFVGVERIQTF
jgi:hypothetical protein